MHVIERTNKDGTFTVTGRYKSIEKAIDALKMIDSPLRHNLWPDGWENTEYGFAPYAWIN